MDRTVEAELSSFITQFDSFILACDAQEEDCEWDTEEFGPMAAYFQADLSAVVLHLISADGQFEEAEAEVFNRMFDTQMSADDLAETFNSTDNAITDYCDGEAQDALETLAGYDCGLDDAYRDLLLSACDVISLCDGVAEGEEAELIARFRDALAG